MDDKGVRTRCPIWPGYRFALGEYRLTFVEARDDVFVFVDDEGGLVQIVSEAFYELFAAEHVGGQHVEARPSSPDRNAIDPAHPAPPRIGEALIGLFCERDRREDMLAVLADKFEEKALARGTRYARRWYWRQVARSFGPFAWQWMRRLAELDSLLKFIGW